jgi:hypothetical protein
VSGEAIASPMSLRNTDASGLPTMEISALPA